MPTRTAAPPESPTAPKRSQAEVVHQRLDVLSEVGYSPVLMVRRGTRARSLDGDDAKTPLQCDLVCHRRELGSRSRGAVVPEERIPFGMTVLRPCQ
ncbi:MAG: hypothetical protein M5U19_16050 [Microthrixaceae bacterium]|nr:hypothetical protein [Microthrixaceae bacterium]